MRLALTGATGFVGRFILAEAQAAGDAVTALTRRAPEGVDHRPYDLAGPPPDLSGFDALIHCGFAHVAGRYRGGEGDDPQGFAARNLDGSVALFEVAVRAGARVVFISSRAVYDGLGGVLREDMDCAPTSLYGQVKLAAERALPRDAMILRATGVYGAGAGHKWEPLFRDFADGRRVAPRAGTELHGADLAAAVRLGLRGAAGVFNASDLMLDRRDLLTEWAAIAEQGGPLPDRAETLPAEMDCSRLRALGWRPGGVARLRETLREMADLRAG
ncbi:MAG: NAD(P)-dependent oxidoreductase [Paracoccus sp. (in: a-proteobacteria)]|nr:NAD(P)-dependent oxidoreductase [Paracoccus sp. (in: a-proteobacteria)]